MRVFSPVIAVFIGLALAACEPVDSVTPEQCQGGDWNTIGFNDGASGKSEGYISRHQEACAKVGITPNASAWQAGRLKGLQSYCTLENAYKVGRNGSELSNVCTGSAVTELNRSNAKGLKYHAIGREISSLRTQLSDINTQLFFLGTPNSEEDQIKKRDYERQAADIKKRISKLELERIDYSVP